MVFLPANQGTQVLRIERIVDPTIARKVGAVLLGVLRMPPARPTPLDTSPDEPQIAFDTRYVPLDLQKTKEQRASDLHRKKATPRRFVESGLKGTVELVLRHQVINPASLEPRGLLQAGEYQE